MIVTSRINFESESKSTKCLAWFVSITFSSYKLHYYLLMVSNHKYPMSRYLNGLSMTIDYYICLREHIVSHFYICRCSQCGKGCFLLIQKHTHTHTSRKSRARQLFYRRIQENINHKIRNQIAGVKYQGEWKSSTIKKVMLPKITTGNRSRKR